MGRSSLTTIIRLVGSLADTAGGQGLEDGQLLHRYVRLHDGDSFAVLMQRHGRLVWSVCRRVLRRDADAEDAFQTTFLTLARHASTIRTGGALASWLYRVAHRVAAKAVRERDTRRACERAADRPAHAQRNDDQSGLGLQAVIDEELQRLPEKYQAPFLLCCLEGKSKAEAAQQLGWKMGTVSGRLAEARKRMRCNLLRRGVTPLAATTAVALAHSPAAAVPGLLVVNTIRLAAGAAVAPVPANVARLAEGACTAMNTKKAIVVAVLLVGGLVAGSTNWMSRTKVEAGAPAEPPRVEVLPLAEEPPPPEPPAPRPADRLDLALRRWHAALNRVQTAACEVTRTEKDYDVNKDAVFQGKFRYLKADESWALEMHQKRDPRDFEKIVSLKENLYWYVRQTKEVRKYQRPLGWPLSDLASDPFCVLFSGMNPAQAKRRFEWKFVKEDQWYIYLGIEPRSNQDRATFSSARLVLLKDSYLPRQIWFQTSGREVTWDLVKMDTAVEVQKEDFVPKVPAGWRLVPVERSEAVTGSVRIHRLGLTVLEPNLSEATVGPGRLNLGMVKVGETVKRRVVLRAEKPFRVAGIEGPAEVTLAPEPDTTPRKVHTVTLEYQPVKPGPFHGEVKFQTNLEGEPVVVILEGAAKP